MVIQFRRGAPSPFYILQDGEPGWDSVNKIFKVGDGSTLWSDLPTVVRITESSIVEVIENYLSTAPPTGVTLAEVQEAIDAHRAETAPHRAYDVDMPSLRVLFENGLV